MSTTSRKPRGSRWHHHKVMCRRHGQARQSLTFGHDYFLIGGESGSKKLAHSEVDALDPVRGSWRSMPPLSAGRHASQPVLFEGNVYLPAGSITRGGTETDSQEVCRLQS